MPIQSALRVVLILSLAGTIPTFAHAQGGGTPQDGSEIGKLLLTLKTTDGRPMAGTRVVVEGRQEEPIELYTDDTGAVSIPDDAFDANADVTLDAYLRYSLDSSLGGLRLQNAYRDDATIETTEVLIRRMTDGDAERNVNPSLASASYLWATGRTRGGVRWAPSTQVGVEVDASCESLDGATPGRPETSGGITWSYQEEGRSVTSFSPLALQFPEGIGRSTTARELVCGERITDEDLPELAIYGLHGFNLDFDEGSWGLRGTAPLPFFREHNLGAAVGLDFFPEDDFSSLFALNADVTASFPWESIGDATAFVGAGPRIYIRSFDTGGSTSSSTEIGVGIVSGMTYGVGPVDLYGDVGIDRLYGSFLPVTHFGVGVAFGGD